MSMGRLTEEQERVLQNYVHGEVVFDLGAGDCNLAARIQYLGASHVVAIEKNRLNCLDEIEDRQIRFSELVEELLAQGETIDVSFISWPNNRHNPALNTLIQLSQVVIYLGSNTNGNACAGPRFFQELLHREVLAYIPDYKNTLIVYGDVLESPRNLSEARGEEFAALTIYQQEMPLSFEEVERSRKRHFRRRSNPLEPEELEEKIVEIKLRNEARGMRRSGKSINSIADHFGIAWDTANQLVSAEYIDPRIERAISRREAGESISKIARELHASKRKIRSWVGHIELGEDPRKPHVRELRLQGYSLRQISRKTGVSWRVVKRWTSDITPGILAIPQHEEAKSLFQKGMNYQEIADYMGIPKTTVFRWVNNPRKRHYKRHRNNPQPSRQIIRYKKPRPMSQEEKRLKARELYQSRDPEILFGGKPSIPKIATKLGISTGTLYSWRKRGLLGPLFTRDDLIDAAMRLYQSNDPEIMTRGRPSAPKIARKLGISQPSINKWLRAGLLWEIPDKEQLIKRGKELFQSCDPEIMTARVPYHPSPLKIAAVINAESGLSLDPTTIWHWIKRGLLGKEPVCERSLTLLQKRAKELYQGCNPEIMGFLHGFPTGKPSIPKIARKLGKRRRAISRWLNEGLMGDEPECDVELTEPQERAKELYQSCDPEIRVRYRGGRLSDKPSLSAIGRRVGVSGPTIKNWIDRGLLGNDPFRRRRYRHNPQPSRQVIRYKKLVPQSKQELMNFIESQTTEPSKNGSQIDDGLLAKHARKSGNPEPSSAAKGNYRTRGIKHAALPAARYQSFSNERITL